jgi:hypothetical protein
MEAPVAARVLSLLWVSASTSAVKRSRWCSGVPSGSSVMADAAASSTLRREREVGPEEERRPGSCESDTVTAGDRLEDARWLGAPLSLGLRIVDKVNLSGVMRSGLPAWGWLIECCGRRLG